MATNDQGYIHDVRVSPAGSGLVADAAIGATVLYVDDAVDFDDNGGTLTVTAMDTSGIMTLIQYQYIAVDYDVDTIWLSPANPLTVAALADDQVGLFPDEPTKTALVALISNEDGEDGITARVPHALNDLLVEGIRDEGQRELVEVVLEDNEWVLKNIIGADPTIQSADYEESESGWILNSDTSQFTDLNVIGSVGADNLSATSLTINNRDLETELLTPFPGGLIAYGVATAPGETASVTSETMMFRFNIGSVYANRVYGITFSGETIGASSVANDNYMARIRYTFDGTVPTAASTIMNSSQCRFGVSNTGGQGFTKTLYYLPKFDYQTVILGITAQRTQGTGAFGIVTGNSNAAFYISVEDLGARTNVGGTMQQTSKTTGAADPLPIATYEYSFPATSSDSYNGTGNSRYGTAVASEMQQGYEYRAYGNTQSVACFDYSAIQAALGSATVIGIALKYTVQHTGTARGVDVYVKGHNLTSLPSTYAPGSGGSELAHQTQRKPGSTYSMTLPLSFAASLQANTSKGIVFYAPSTTLTQAGYMYGATSDRPPTLVITYTK